MRPRYVRDSVYSCLNAKLYALHVFKIPLRQDGEATTHAQSATATAAVDANFFAVVCW